MTGIPTQRVVREVGAGGHVAFIPGGAARTARTTRATWATWRAVRIATGPAGTARATRTAGPATAGTTFRLAAGLVRPAGSTWSRTARTTGPNRTSRLQGRTLLLSFCFLAQPWGKSKRAAR